MKFYDKPAYKLEDYKKLRQLNRTAFMLNPLDYVKLQSDWEDLFTICVKGNVYVLNSFYEGIRYMKSHYRECIPELQSFDSIFTLKHSLPEEIDYMYRRLSGPSHTVVIICHTSIALGIYTLMILIRRRFIQFSIHTSLLINLYQRRFRKRLWR